MNLPTHREVVTTEHQWTLEVPCDAKTFSFAYSHVQTEMSSLGVDFAYDDCFEVRATEDAIVFVVKRRN